MRVKLKKASTTWPNDNNNGIVFFKSDNDKIFIPFSLVYCEQVYILKR